MGAKCALISLIPISGGGGLLQSHSQDITFQEARWIEEGKVGKEQLMAKMGSEVPRGSPPLSRAGEYLEHLEACLALSLC